MRIIDADEFKRQIAGMAIVNGYSAQKANKMCELIDKQPTVYDLDKVLKQLTDESEKCSICELPTCKEDESHCCYCDGLNKAIEIVKAVSMNNNSKNTRKDG